MTRATPPRRWRTHVLAVALCAVGAIAGYVGGIVTLLVDYPACVADFSEDSIVAPKSNRAWLVCSIASDGELTDSTHVLVVLLGAPILLSTVGLVVWVRAKRFAVVLPFLAAAVLIPWVWGGVVATLSPDCSNEQYAEHGPEGCERSEETRPGINHY